MTPLWLPLSLHSNLSQSDLLREASCHHCVLNVTPSSLFILLLEFVFSPLLFRYLQLYLFHHCLSPSSQLGQRSCLFCSLNIPEIVHRLTRIFETINESLAPFSFWSPCSVTEWGAGLGSHGWVVYTGFLPLLMASSSSEGVSPSPIMLAPSRSSWT